LIKRKKTQTSETSVLNAYPRGIRVRKKGHEYARDHMV